MLKNIFFEKTDPLVQSELDPSKGIPFIRISQKNEQTVIEVDPSQAQITESLPQLLFVVKQVNQFASEGRLVVPEGLSQKEKNTLVGNLVYLNQKLIRAVFERSLSDKEFLMLLRTSLKIPENITNETLKSHVLEVLRSQSISQLGKKTSWKSIVSIFNQMVCFYAIEEHFFSLREYSRILDEPLEISMQRVECADLLVKRLISPKTRSRIMDNAQKEIPVLSQKFLYLFDVEQVMKNTPSSPRHATTVLDRSFFSRTEKSSPVLIYDPIYDVLTVVEKAEIGSLVKSHPGFIAGDLAYQKFVHLLSDPVALEQEIVRLEALDDFIDNLERILSQNTFEPNQIKTMMGVVDRLSKKFASEEMINSPRVMLQSRVCARIAYFRNLETRLQKLASLVDAGEPLSFSAWLQGSELKEIIQAKALAIYENYLHGLKRLTLHHIELSDRDSLISLTKGHLKRNKNVTEHETFFKEEFLELIRQFGIDMSDIAEVFEAKQSEIEGHIGDWQKEYTKTQAETVTSKFQDKIKHTTTEEPLEYKIHFMVDVLVPLYANALRLREYLMVLEGLHEKEQEILQIGKVRKILRALERIYEVYTKDLNPDFIKPLEYRAVLQSFRQEKDPVKALQILPPDLLNMFVEALRLQNQEKTKEEILHEIQQNPQMLLSAKNRESELLVSQIEKMVHFSENRPFIGEEVDLVIESWVRNLREQIAIVEQAGQVLIDEGVVGSVELRADPLYQEHFAPLEKRLPNLKVYYDPFTISFQLVTSRLWMPVEAYIKMIGRSHANFEHAIEVLKTLKRLTETANLFL